jgi:hypothetical protein
MTAQHIPGRDICNHFIDAVVAGGEGFIEAIGMLELYTVNGCSSFSANVEAKQREGSPKAALRTQIDKSESNRPLQLDQARGSVAAKT